MNKSAIQKFAIWARTEMIAQVEQRAYQYGITKDGYGEENAVTIMGRALSNQEQEQRWELIQQIKHKGYTQVMEEVAYTWFNRFIALRFMEVNNYLPTHIRVFSDANGAFKPEILSCAMQIDLDGLDRAKVAEMIDANQTEELYRYLLMIQCNALNEALPRMFEKMGGYTEILLPNNILRADGVLGRMVADIPEADWNVNSMGEDGKPQGQVEIIGWLYQYYNSELKDDTFALLKKNVKITKERIPSATQLFTPDWIVRYMVENSLGRLWIEGHPNEELKSGWKYYLDEAEQEPEVQVQLEKIRAEYRALKPQDIKVIDPCMGSGHILVYAFDVLVQIYKSYGISERDAAKLILEKNLYGLDIDDRAAQLAYFAVMMKARQYDRRIFSRGVEPHIYAIQESNTINRRHLKFFGWQMSDLERNLALNQLNTVLNEFNDAKEYGSILNISRQDWELLYRFVGSVDYSDQMTLEAMGLEDTKGKLFELVQIAATMAQKYDVVVTNPPYMGASGMGTKLADRVKKDYPDSKSDLFAVFIERCGQMTAKNRYQAMITQHAWMFLSSYEKLRAKLLHTDTVNMAHLGPRAFEEIGGEVVQTTSFVMRRSDIAGYLGTYCRLIEPTTQQGKEDMFLSCACRYTAQQSNFFKIPGAPVAYWVSNKFYDCFVGKEPLDNHYSMREGIHTADNNRFLRLWHEISNNKFVTTARTYDDIDRLGKWVPYNKGGQFRKWYGNNEYVICFDLQSRNEMETYQGHVRPSQGLYFKEGGTWTAVSGGNFGIRYYPEGFLFDAGGQVAVGKNIRNCIAYLNSAVFSYIAKVTMPTINFKCGVIKTLPDLCIHDPVIDKYVATNIQLSKDDWDSFETSWDFKKHPLV